MADTKNPTASPGPVVDKDKAIAELNAQVLTLNNKWEASKTLHTDLFNILGDHAITPGAAVVRIRERLAKFGAEYINK